MNDTTKTCTKCGNVYPATTEYFSPAKGGKYNLKSWCKSCSLEYTLSYKQANYDKVNERNRKYMQEYTKINKDRLREKAREHYQNNKSKIIERVDKYYKANLNKVRAYRRQYNVAYQKANPDKGRVKTLRYRARKQSLPNTFTEQQWLACLEYHHYCCAVCGKQLRDLLGEIEPHADHWIPLSSDECPGTIASNMICLCSVCNMSKKAKMPDMWLKQKYGTRKANEILKRVETYFRQIE